jgi:hypothetical protein
MGTGAVGGALIALEATCGGESSAFMKTPMAIGSRTWNAATPSTSDMSRRGRSAHGC